MAENNQPASLTDDLSGGETSAAWHGHENNNRKSLKTANDGRLLSVLFCNKKKSIGK